MSLRLEGGAYALSGGGLPLENDEAQDLAQRIWMRLTLPQGAFPYGRGMGSRLGRITGEEDHREELAVSLANEALLDLPGVSARQAAFLPGGGIRFIVATPLGEQEVIYGND